MLARITNTSHDFPLCLTPKLRLGRYFGMSPQFWLGLQMDYDLDVTADYREKRLKKEVKPRLAAI